MRRASLYVTVLSLLVLGNGWMAEAARRTKDGSEEWGYVEVRPKAHMFWWLYRSPNRVDDPSKPWPVILWLQGGPGGSGVGIGNFKEIGPLDTRLKPRKLTWLKKADLLFVDNPVGTGYSFVEDPKLFVKTDEEAATDLTTLLRKIFNRNECLQKRVALGDSWISPEDFVFSWGPLLKDVSRLDDNDVKKSNRVAEKIRQQLMRGQYREATASWNELERLISSSSNSVDFYNFLVDEGMDHVSMEAVEPAQGASMNRYLNYLKSSPNDNGNFDTLMNVVVKKKLQIIPANLTWGEQSDSVFSALGGDFMKPRIKEVDELLAKGVNVTIYNGQLDVICATKGTEAWVKKLKWKGLKRFLRMERTPLYCGTGRVTKGFKRSYKNLHFYWILGAGHFVPVDQPCVSLEMVAAITQSPASNQDQSNKKKERQ
ncbi:hypothetical protein NL676_031149 [Syzygium grande]|nr:hypothetical protein NL676_031149 [Syzygium grande]